MIVVGWLLACGPAGTSFRIENGGTSALTGVRWEVRSSPPRDIAGADVPAGATSVTTVSETFGEASAVLHADRAGVPLEVTCGYLEGNGSYRAVVKVTDQGASCDVEI